MSAEKIESFKNFEKCSLEGPRNVEYCNFASSFSSVGLDNSFNLARVKRGLQIKLQECTKERVVLDIINMDVSFVNALRRILIAEVPTIAIDVVQMWQNTGVLQDEVLCHRLGLIPLKIDPDSLEYRKDHDELSDENSIKFNLHVIYPQTETAASQEKSIPVYARDLKWVPLSKRQLEKFQSQPPAPVEPKILITRLAVGQEIEADLFCNKGCGRTHAKWSPVATAVYRLLPVFDFPQGPIANQEAVELKNICPMNVFDIEDGVAVPARPRDCTTCRICLERFKEKIVLLKHKNHFIFTIESTGSIEASRLFVMAVQVLRDKAVKTKKNLFSFC